MLAIVLRRRWPTIIGMQAGTLCSAMILTVWDVPDAFKYVAFYLLYFAAGVPGPWFVWYADFIPHDHEFRGFAMALSNMFSYIMQIWFQSAVWRTIDAPRFHAGFVAAAVVGAAMVILCFILRLLQQKDDKRREREKRLWRMWKLQRRRARARKVSYLLTKRKRT